MPQALAAKATHGQHINYLSPVAGAPTESSEAPDWLTSAEGALRAESVTPNVSVLATPLSQRAAGATTPAPTQRLPTPDVVSPWSASSIFGATGLRGLGLLPTPFRNEKEAELQNELASLQSRLKQREEELSALVASNRRKDESLESMLRDVTEAMQAEVKRSSQLEQSHEAELQAARAEVDRLRAQLQDASHATRLAGAGCAQVSTGPEGWTDKIVELLDALPPAVATYVDADQVLREHDGDILGAAPVLLHLALEHLHKMHADNQQLRAECEAVMAAQADAVKKLAASNASSASGVASAVVGSAVSYLRGVRKTETGPSNALASELQLRDAEIARLRAALAAGSTTVGSSVPGSSASAPAADQSRTNVEACAHEACSSHVADETGEHLARAPIVAAADPPDYTQTDVSDGIASDKAPRAPPPRGGDMVSSQLDAGADASGGVEVVPNGASAKALQTQMESGIPDSLTLAMPGVDGALVSQGAATAEGAQSTNGATPAATSHSVRAGATPSAAHEGSSSEVSPAPRAISPHPSSMTPVRGSTAKVQACSPASGASPSPTRNPKAVKYVDTLLGRANRAKIPEDDAKKALEYFEAAKVANSSEDYKSACSYFETSFLLNPKLTTLISTANMCAQRLNLCGACNVGQR